jgi:hypothetical protein
MRQSSDNRPTSVGFEPTSVGRRVAAQLRERHPVKTAQAVSAETGIPAATIEKLIERENLPSAATLWALLKAYGASFMVATFPDPPRWLTDAAHAERIARAEAALIRAKADLETALEARP